MSELTLTIKCSNADKATVVIESTATVMELKEKIAVQLSVPAAQQRLIYKGRVLKDESALEIYSIEDGHTVHMVKGAAAGGSSAPSTGGTGAAAVQSSSASSNGGTFPFAAPPAGGFNPGNNNNAANPLSALFGNQGASPLGNVPLGPGGMPDMSRMQEQLMRNPEMMRQVMSSPMMDNLLNNPDMMRNMMLNNPQMQALLDSNPQLRHVLNDPTVSL